MDIKIENLTPGQAYAIQDLLALMVSMGEQKASRWVSLFVDGANDFQPTVSIDGAAPVRCAIGTMNRWHPVYFKNPLGEFEPEEMYFMDPSQIDGSLSVLPDAEPQE